MKKILFFIFCTIALYSCQTTEYDPITNCSREIIVKTIFEGEQFDEQLCVECKSEFLVSKNLKKCIHYYQDMGQQRFKNCQRLNYNGYCAEARIGLELIDGEQFSYISEIAFGDRCAIVDPTYIKCLYPRFGYILDIKKQILWMDVESRFCALYDSDLSECIQYFDGFIYDKELDLTLYLGEQFINPQHIIINGEGFRNIQCKEDFEFLKKDVEQFDIFNIQYFKTLIIGCFEKKTQEQLLEAGVKNCLEHVIEKRICQKCNQGYSLSSDKQSCKLITFNCDEYDNYFGEESCSLCKQFYQQNYQKCILMKGCQQLQKGDPNICSGCQNNYKLKEIWICSGCQNNYKLEEVRYDIRKTECVKDVEISGCQIKGVYKCIKCTMNQMFFVSDDGTCALRKVSKNCIDKSNRSDSCESFLCEKEYYFQSNIRNRGYYWSQFVVFYPLLQQMRKYNETPLHYLGSENYCIKRKYTQIEGCEIYNPFGDECIVCQNDYVRIRDGHFKCIFDKKLSTTDTIENCLRYDAKSQICLKCKEGYMYLYTDDEKKLCRKLPENCEISSEDGKSCQICKKGYKRKTYQCKRENEENCYGIIHGKQTSYKTNVLDNSSDQCEMRNQPCQSELQGTCLKCYLGFALDISSSLCIPDIDFPNCSVIIQVNENSFSMENLSNKAVKNGMICQSCQDNYILDKGLCYCSSIACKVIYLQEQSGTSKTYAYHYYTYQKKQQLNVLQNEYFDQYGQVDVCRQSNCLTCLKNSCAKCTNEYIYDPLQGQCIKRCNGTTCIDGLEFDNPYQQYSCKERYSNWKCKSCDQFIMLGGYCQTECPFDYIQTIHLNQRYCYKCPPNCLTCTFDFLLYSSQGRIKCLSCIPGKYLDNTYYSCIDECSSFLDDENNCLQTCGEGYFVSQNKCVKQCPHYYRVNKEKNILECTDTCNKLENPYSYLDKPKMCSKSCEMGYAVDVKNKLCLKCTQNNCKLCAAHSLNICTECSSNYALSKQDQCQYLCANGEYASDKSSCNTCSLLFCEKCSDNNQFCQKCKEGFQLTNSFNCSCETGKFINKLSRKCDFCHSECVECHSSDGCKQCSEGYYLAQIELKENINSISTKIIYTCTKLCPKGTYPSTENTPVCAKCPQFGCISCNSQTECTECSDKFHRVFNSEQKKYSCECKPDYFFDGISCKHKCSVSMKIVENENECCSVENCEDCSIDYRICLKCNSLRPFLVNNQCLLQCTEGTFQNEEGQCEKCSQPCKTCEKSSIQCLSCILPNNILDQQHNCRCKNNLFLFKEQCLSKCPIYSRVLPSNSSNVQLNICEPYCNMSLKQYPLFDNKNQFIACENPNGQDSQFCEQHLQNILSVTTFSIEPKTLERKNSTSTLKIFISSTPLSCYSFRLRGNQKFSFLLEQSEIQIDDQINTFLSADISEQDLQNRDLFVCNFAFCFLNLEIYNKNQLRLTIKLRVNILSNIVGIEGIKDSEISESSAASVVSLSSIQESQLVPSVHSIECMAQSNCNYKKVETQPQNPISISITAKNPQTNDSVNAMKIKSIYLIGQDQQQQPIKNFYFENLLSKTMKIILSFQNEVDGVLVIINEVLKNNLDQSNDENQPFYLVSKVDLTVKKQEKIKDEGPNEQQQPKEEKSYQDFFIAFNTIVCLILVLFAFYKIFGICKSKIISTKFMEFREDRNDSVQIELK